MNQTEKSEDYKKKESETALIKSKPKKQIPSSKAKSASTRLSNDLPKNLLSVNQVVNNKGELSGQLLVKAIDKRGNEIQATLDEKELALGRCEGLAHFAVRAGMSSVMSPKGLRTLAAILPESAGKEVYVARQEGFHMLHLHGQRYGFYVLREKPYFFGRKPPLAVTVINEVAGTDPPSGDLTSWQKAIGVHLAGNPYMLVSVLSALAPALARAFGLSIPILMIVAPSSVGKTTLQQVGRSIREPADKIDDASGTTNGLRVKLEQHADAPVFLQDIHKAEDVKGLMSLCFLIANGGQRLTSTANQKVQAGSELSCGASFSSEMSFMEMVGDSKMSLPEGFSARCFELVLQGKHGAFHTLPQEMKAHEFANQLKRDCGQHYGSVWTQWISSIAEDADALRDEIPGLLKKAESSLLEDITVTDRVTLRLVSGLAVWIVAGWLASKYKVLNLKRTTVSNAMRLILREHVDRQAHQTTPIGEKVITTVRDFIDRNASRFPALAMFGRTDQSNVLGYTKGCGVERIYLLLPGVLEALLAEKFGLQMALQKLHDAGFLLKNNEGWQMQVRLPMDEKLRKRFYAIRSSICFDGETAD